jgi:hypothetical protein
MDSNPEERKSSPITLPVTQFLSPSSYSHPPNSSTHILKQTHSLSLCNVSGFHSGGFAKNSGRLRHEAVFRRLFCAPSTLEQCRIQPTCALSSSEQPCCNSHAHIVMFNTFLGHVALKRVSDDRLHQRKPCFIISEEGTEGYELQYMECNKKFTTAPIAHPHQYNCTYSIHPTNSHAVTPQ